MRTTLAIDDDILAAAKELATIQEKSLGEIISNLARRALSPTEPNQRTRNGIPLLPIKVKSSRVTSELVHTLREELM